MISLKKSIDFDTMCKRDVGEVISYISPYIIF